MATTSVPELGASFSDEERGFAAMLVEAGQEHIFAGWDDGHEAEKHAFFEQVKGIQESYPGGISAYVTGARKLLADSAAGVNPLAGYTPEVPEGLRLEFGSPEFLELEALGLSIFKDCALVLVAGGLGERLGFGGIKISLPTETSTGTTYMGYYAQQILALQQASNAAAGTDSAVPLAIMTSGDTHARTEALLKENDNFGLAADQVTLMRQEKVPSLIDNDARIALAADSPYSIQTKPHGHGDVHTLLHLTGLAAKWAAEGRKYIVFFQDTNGLAFTSTLASLGASARESLAFNSICVPRKAKEAVGAIARLKHTDGSSFTCNVEYNQLEPLLLATLGTGDENDATGFSPFPGNINQLLIDIPEYAKTLEKTKGLLAEFVNPKYADETKTKFKAPTRLECMMQDLPKSWAGLPPAEAPRVGFTQLDAWTYSPVKNSLKEAVAKAALGILPRCASEGEVEFYEAAAKRLRALGCDVAEAKPWEVTGFTLPRGPHIVLHPNVGPTQATLAPKFPSPADVHIADGSTLIVKGSGVVIEKLNLKGTLVIDAVDGANVVIKNLTVENSGWDLEPLPEGSDAPERLLIRGYDVVRRESRELKYDTAGDFVVDEA